MWESILALMESSQLILLQPEELAGYDLEIVCR